jgi:dsRNA-specific ribonuclease
VLQLSLDGNASLEMQMKVPFAQEELCWRNVFTHYSAKTLSDMVESLLGVFVEDGQFDEAEQFLCSIGVMDELGEESQTAIRATVSSSEEPNESEIKTSCISPKELARISQLEGILGYKFRNRSLLSAALSPHPLKFWSVGKFKPPKWITFERLEFIGDAAHDFLVTRYYYNKYSCTTPGEFTELRQAILNNDHLGKLAVHFQLDGYLDNEDFVLARDIQSFSDWIKANPNSSWSDYKIHCPKVLADVYEAVMGAIYIDLNFDIEAMWAVVIPQIEKFLQISPEGSGTIASKHPWSEFIEICASVGVDSKQVQVYFTEIKEKFECKLAQSIIDNVNASNSSFDSQPQVGRFKCFIWLQGLRLTEGEGQTRAIAKRDASLKGIEIIKSRGFRHFVV